MNWKNRLEAWLMRYINLLIVSYLALRLYFFFHYPTTGYLQAVVLIFLFAEAFFLVHAYGYFRYLRKVTEAKKNPVQDAEPPPLHSYPPVAIVVASYKEPIAVLEDTLICFYNLTYPNKQLYFLDDTRYDAPWDVPERAEQYKKEVEDLCQSIGINLFRRKWHHAKAGMINDFLDYIQGRKKEGFTLTRYDDSSWCGEEKYIIIFDADMNPLPNFVEPLVARMESQPDVALVQTPQYYTNFDQSRVAKAASLMQVVFYEWILEAKSLQELTIFCGSNVILRVEALRAVGGIDLSSVTEDFATTFKLHQQRWKSLYVNVPCAFGLGPEDLGAFFKQQDRWARGTVAMLPKTIGTFLRHPLKFPLAFYWEYFLSSSYYLVGWMYLILMSGPVVYLLLDVRLYQFPTWLYGAAMFPYALATNFLFYWTLCQRGYAFKDLFMGTTLSLITTPVYMKASLQGLLGIKGHFVVTPKDAATQLPLRDLWPQLAFCLVAFVTIVWGFLRLIFEGEPLFGLIFNLFWISFYFAIFSSVFYFNQPQKT